MSYNATQFAWAYLIKHGYANTRPSLYGGAEAVDASITKDKTPCHTWPSLQTWYVSYNQTCREMIRTIGVDWNATQSPSSDYFSQFEGTFCDSSRKEYMTGIIYLKNGQTIFYHSDTFVTGVFDMMAAYHEMVEEMNELFGEE